jgi:hypothetical protein
LWKGTAPISGAELGDKCITGGLSARAPALNLMVDLVANLNPLMAKSSWPSRIGLLGKDPHLSTLLNDYVCGELHNSSTSVPHGADVGMELR